MAGRLAGKIALISGAARGIGATEARLFVREGAQVVLGDVLEQESRRWRTISIGQPERSKLSFSLST